MRIAGISSDANSVGVICGGGGGDNNTLLLLLLLNDDDDADCGVDEKR